MLEPLYLVHISSIILLMLYNLNTASVRVVVIFVIFCLPSLMKEDESKRWELWLP
uniref:Uncharacterized protein n=1 Tax=Rhizophora mucronata TaxID=61149 RepID=A0A2P2QIP6_RHIMU